MLMTVQERVCLCRLIEKIEKNKEFAEIIGITNESKFREDDPGKSKIDNRYHSDLGMAFSC